MTPLLPVVEADVWAPTRDEGYLCGACGLTESRLTNADDYSAFRTRWNDEPEVWTQEQWDASAERIRRIDDEDARAWTWPTEDWQGISNRENRRALLAASRVHDEFDVETATKLGWELPEYKYGFPVGETFVEAVLQAPDDDAVRSGYASWLRAQPTETASHVADFIEAQLGMAAALRADPTVDVTSRLPAEAFSYRGTVSSDSINPDDTQWWRYPGTSCGHGPVRGAGYDGLGESLRILQGEGLIDEGRYYRGFIEHVAIKAARFLEIADELYSLAPIRHLTITYCKGFDHTDTGLLKTLLASPHLDRIRSMRLPVQVVGKPVTELNRLTDADLELFAASTHLRGLRYLDLVDESHLTIRGFHALAASPNLPALSAVRYDLNRYPPAASFASFGDVGPYRRELADRPLKRYTAELEAKHGRIAWLHPVENYGTETPDLEAVVEHPVALLKSSS